MDISGILFDFFADIGFNAETVVFVFSLIPLIELRGAMPIGVAIGLTPFRSWLFSFLGSVAAVPLVLVLFRPVLGFLKRKKVFAGAVADFEIQLERNAARIMSHVMRKQKKSSKNRDSFVKVYKMLLAALFVAVPLPMTGVWTGTAVAACIGLGNIEVILSVVFGQLIASVLVAVLVFCFSDHIDIVLLLMAAIVAVGITAFIWKRATALFLVRAKKR